MTKSVSAGIFCGTVGGIIAYGVATAAMIAIGGDSAYMHYHSLAVVTSVVVAAIVAAGTTELQVIEEEVKKRIASSSK